MVLATRRLLLRDMRTEDAEFLSAYQSDIAYLEHYSEQPAAAAIVAAAITWAQKEPRSNFQLAVVLESAVTVIGCAGLRQQGYPTGEAEVGVEINPSYWRRGLAKEVLNALIEFGVSNLNISRYWAITTPSNRPAQRLVEGIGFRRYADGNESRRFMLQIAVPRNP